MLALGGARDDRHAQRCYIPIPICRFILHVGQRAKEKTDKRGGRGRGMPVALLLVEPAVPRHALPRPSRPSRGYHAHRLPFKLWLAQRSRERAGTGGEGMVRAVCCCCHGHIIARRSLQQHSKRAVPPLWAAGTVVPFQLFCGKMFRPPCPPISACYASRSSCACARAARAVCLFWRAAEEQGAKPAGLSA